MRSKTEVWLMKKIAKKGPVTPVKKEVDLFDVWGSSSSGPVAAPAFAAPSNNVQKFKDFSKRSMTRVRPVMAPYAGQSVNPALQAHKEVLKKVINEEEREIEENYKGSFQRGKDEGNNALEKLKELRKQAKAKSLAKSKNPTTKSEDVKESEEEVSESDEASEESNQSEGEGKTRKPVDCRKALTQTQRNAKKLGKAKNQAYIDKANERRMAKQYDKVQVFINQDKKETKDQKANI